jgi:hypothetical protein
MKKWVVGFVLVIMVTGLHSCSVYKLAYSPNKKYPKEDLQKDLSLLRQILEKKHPSLYWYTTKDSMDVFFDQHYALIKDSMNEQQFTWQVLAPLVDKIHCGHTSVGSSKAYQKWAVGKRLPSFPLFLKVWNDSMAVLSSLRPKDTVFKRGTLVTSVNGVRNADQVKHFFNYMPEDGYAHNANYIRLSGNYPYFHRNIYGLSKQYAVTYLDQSGVEQSTSVPLFVPVKDTTTKTVREKAPKQKLSKSKIALRYRSLEIDSSKKYAVMTLNSFAKGRLRTFFRKSFRSLKKENIDHLILDIRNNGGGNVMWSTLLTKYISKKPFKVSDSTYAVARGLGKYSRYIKGGRLNNIEMFFISRKRKDGYYHVGLLEKKLYQPKQHNHYNGSVYVLTSGPTFSASSLFCNAIKGQKGITLVGEETGGGWHGNSGIMIPDIKLPNTKTRVRLPLYRLVQYQHVPKNGSGVVPDIYVGTSYEALIKGYDYKMKVVRDLILNQ